MVLSCRGLWSSCNTKVRGSGIQGCLRKGRAINRRSIRCLLMSWLRRNNTMGHHRICMVHTTYNLLWIVDMVGVRLDSWIYLDCWVWIMSWSSLLFWLESCWSSSLLNLLHRLTENMDHSNLYSSRTKETSSSQRCWNSPWLSLRLWPVPPGSDRGL